MPGTGWALLHNYLSAYNVEKQHAGAHKEVTPQIICKHLLIKSPARGAAFRKRIWGMATYLSHRAVQVLPQIKGNPDHSSLEALWAVLSDLQFNTCPWLSFRFVRKTTSAFVVKSSLGEMSTLSFKVAHKNFWLYKFILFPFLPRRARSSETNMTIIVPWWAYRSGIIFNPNF